MLKTDLYSAIKSEGSEAPGSMDITLRWVTCLITLHGHRYHSSSSMKRLSWRLVLELQGHVTKSVSHR